MSDTVIDGVGYNKRNIPIRGWHNCHGCVGDGEPVLCNKLPESCGSDSFIWVLDVGEFDRVSMKGHKIAEMVTEIRNNCVANSTEELDSLRQVISQIVHKYVKPY